MFNEFTGIRPLIEGIVDSDYLNCVPTGTTVVDRTCYYPIVDSDFVEYDELTRRIVRFRPHIEGAYRDPSGFENIIWTPWEDYYKREYVRHVTSWNIDKILIRVYTSTYEALEAQHSEHPTQFLYFIITDFETNESWGTATPLAFNPTSSSDDYQFPSKWSWCVSNTKPRQVYCTFDGFNIFWFTLDYFGAESERGDNGRVFCMMSYDKTVPTTEVISNNYDYQVLFYRDFYPSDLSRISNDNLPKYEEYPICWYDNKLCAVNKDTGVVNLTCTDPAQFLRTTPTSESRDWCEYRMNNVWTNWYASTLSSDTIVSIIPAFGNLYFINKDSIETWGRTGSEAAPLTNISAFVTRMDVVKAKFVSNQLIAIAYDNGKIGAYSISANAMTKISNSAVDKLLNDVNEISFVWQNDETHLAFLKQNEMVCFNQSANAWYRLTDVSTNQPYLFITKDICFNWIGEQLNVTNRVLDYKLNQQREPEPSLLERRIIDSNGQFQRRVTFSLAEIYGDLGDCDLDDGNTGVSDKYRNVDTVALENMDVYPKVGLSVSTNHGKTWFNERYVKTPPLGKYDAKLQYFGLGSGESILLKIRWFTQHHFVINGIDIRAR